MAGCCSHSMVWFIECLARTKATGFNFFGTSFEPKSHMDSHQW